MDGIKVQSEAQAIREIEIAKEMIACDDYVSARAKLHSVRDSFPALDHIDAMIIVCDTLHSAGLSLDCETDWYWVLQLTPAAGKNDIQTQYYKSRTLLEPIIRQSYPGAASAMKIVQEAFSVLSNPDTRLLFNMKRKTIFESYGLVNSPKTLMQGFHLAGNMAHKGNRVAALQKNAMSGKFIQQKWSEEYFVPGQIWAVYDAPDYMPRRYVVINNVVSENKVCATSLEPYPVVDENLRVGCGSFRAGKTILNLGMCRFAHSVNYELSTSKLYRIYPKKGEVWAMYKRWNSKWKQSDFTYCQYQVVEIITDFEETGLKVASLTEVPGRASFFHRQVADGFELVRAVSSTEMLSFSHQIATISSPGDESSRKNYWHLNPEALPPNHMVL